GREITAGMLAERFGFRGDRGRTLVRDLSGGERRRLQLMRLLMGEPNVLLLDEPTNDLDVETLTALEDLLDGWPGTLVVASHDRYVLERVCDRFVGLLGDGTVRDLPRGIEEYLERRAAVRELPDTSAPAAQVSDARDARAARKELARVERRLARLAAEAEGLHRELAVHAADYARVVDLDARLQAVLYETAG